MNELKYYIILICLALLLFNCSQPNELDEPIEKDKQNYSIPDSIIQKSNMIIISRVGQKFFDSYIKLDSSVSKFSPPDSFCIKNPSRCADLNLIPHYNMVYKLKMLDNKYINTFIEFVVDTCGDLVLSGGLGGMPKCPNNDCWGNFPVISKERAIEIAKENGLEEGIKEWEIKFHFFYGTFNDYVWEIKNTLIEEKYTPSQYKSSGKGLLINASDGSIFQSFGWMIIT
ncbi:hypothetical protein HZA55_10135 [Candidatus Poribacteria bacterium]|nr:hypothetical protein [Candidatus Poribacteria bacterium]